MGEKLDLAASGCLRLTARAETEVDAENRRLRAIDWLQYDDALRYVARVLDGCISRPPHPAVPEEDVRRAQSIIHALRTIVR